MTILPSISSSTYESVNLNCRVSTCRQSKFGKEASSAPPRSWTLAARSQFRLRKSELHVNLVKSAQNVKHENDTALLPEGKITKPPHFSSVFLSIINRVAKSVSILSYIKGGQCDIKLNLFEGRMLQGGLVFRQSFPVRSYEVGTDYRATMEALMSYLQVGVSLPFFVFLLTGPFPLKLISLLLHGEGNGTEPLQEHGVTG